MTFVHQIVPANHKTQFMSDMERVISTRTTDPAELNPGVSYADVIYYSPKRGNVIVGEKVVDKGDGLITVTRTVYSDKLKIRNQRYKSVEHFDKNTGKCSVTLMEVKHKPFSTKVVSEKVISSYEMNLNDALPNRKFANGIRGKLQKLALKIGSDANGCERPVLSKVSGFIFNTVKKAK